MITRQWRALAPAEIAQLEANGCRAEDWATVRVGEGFDPARMHNVGLGGEIWIGALRGNVAVAGGVTLPAEIADATLVDCRIGDGCRITRVGSHIARYEIGDGALVTDVGTLATQPGATFGNGVEVACVNEAGGREVILFNALSSQFAWLMAMRRWQPALAKGLRAIAAAAVEEAKSEYGRIGAGARVTHVGEMIDVCVGPAAEVSGAASLRNGTILSEPAAPARVGAGVVAKDFIIGEGSSVDSGAILAHVFVGQGVQMGKQYSAENSLFFANCEAFHGEACSIFAGPYTVSHHKGSLLIANAYSFYNAGSGTNHSNHMYKLGPVHQGQCQRGSKTGSFSYMLLPTVLGPFSVLIGKHLTSFDAGDFPFSYITDEGGKAVLTPAMNMFTVGTLRDGEKWPKRDRRKATRRRDQILFDVMNPCTVGAMMRGERTLLALYEKTPKDVDELRHKGLTIKRMLLRFGAKNYAGAIDAYLGEQIVARAAAGAGLAASREAVDSEEWADAAGLLIARGRLERIEAAIERGAIADAEQFLTAMEEAAAEYEADAWAWVRRTYEARNGRPVDSLTAEELEALAAATDKWKVSLYKKVLADAEKEFDEVARFGYGADGPAEAAAADFEAVRGTFDGNSFVKDLRARIERAQRAKSAV